MAIKVEVETDSNNTTEKLYMLRNVVDYIRHMRSLGNKDPVKPKLKWIIDMVFNDPSIESEETVRIIINERERYHD
jgi:hypothetical protein